ncbi:MAG: transglutaminase domain-containing protein [Bacillota bacterium]|nr:transglutaminase domain-containing protein [Bacillota bacterium]
MSIYSISKDKKGKFKARRYFIYSLSISLIILITTNITLAFFPLEKINKNISSFMPVFTSLRTGYTSRADQYIFQFKGTMYQPEGDKLGGKITNRNYDVLMLVDSDEGGQYLRGAVKDYYTGESWESTNIKYRNRIIWNKDDSNRNTMRIYYKNIQTATLFTPIYIKSIDLNRNKVFMNEDEILYYDRDSFEKRMDYFDLEYYNKPVNTSGISNLDMYLQLPKNITERLEELAFSLTKDDFNDEEKITSIKIFLRENYPYTLLVDYVPENLEFVDYFIFEGKEGYCTYFATAMAIMARINNIPSRYVEGFITSIEKNNQHFYEVTADRAHAWAEVYYNGHWNTIESTPHYYNEGRYGDMSPELITDTDIKQINRLKDKELLEPVIINKSDNDANSLFSVIIVILLVCFSVITLYNVIVYKKKFNQMTIKDKLKFIIYMSEHLENKDERYIVPEKVIINFLSNEFGYTMSQNMTISLQKLFYSTELIKAEEKRYITKEIDLIENLIIKKNKFIKYVIIKRKFCKENMF